MSPDDIRAVCAARKNKPDALIEILLDIQSRDGFVSAETIRIVAEALNLSRADVHGVVSFYEDLRDHPHGARTVRICRGEACQAVGARALEADVCTGLGIGMGETAQDGSVTLEAVYCLGNCALGPSAELDGRLTARTKAADVIAYATGAQEAAQ